MLFVRGHRPHPSRVSDVASARLKPEMLRRFTFRFAKARLDDDDDDDDDDCCRIVVTLAISRAFVLMTRWNMVVLVVLANTCHARRRRVAD
jgi:hypothetical protein